MPTPDDQFESEGQPALYSAPPGQDLDLDQDPPIAPSDRPLAVTDYGPTPAEERTQEPLYRRVAREEPEVGEELEDFGEEDPVAARLLEPDSAVDEIDITAEGAGREPDSLEDSAGLSAEEAAVHVIPDDRV